MPRGVIGRKETGWTIEVDPAEFSVENTYTVEQVIDSVPLTWTGIRPYDEDGRRYMFLPMKRY